MRRKYLISGLVGLAFTGIAGTVNAEPIEHTITLGATIPSSCAISGTASVTSGPFTDVNQQSSTFTIDVTGTTANSTTGEISIGTITCTSSSIKITLDPDGWVKRSSGSGEITYSAYVKDGSTTLNSGNALINQASGTGAKDVTLAASTMSLGIQITTNQSTNLPAGSYTGALLISVDPV